MKYRKRPVVIEAFKYTKHNQGYIPLWAVRAFENGVLFYSGEGYKNDLCINTLEGVHHVSAGDYIIRGVAGELYPCKPDIFELTYEEVE